MRALFDVPNESKETEDAAEVNWDGCQAGTDVRAHIDEARQISSQTPTDQVLSTISLSRDGQ